MDFFSADNYYGLIDIGIYLCYAGSVISVLLALIFPVVFIVKDPKQAKTTLVAVGITAVLFGISYALSTGEVTEKFISLGVNTEMQSKLISAGLILTYITGIASVILAVAGEIMSNFRR